MSIQVVSASGDKQERALRVLFHDLLPHEQAEQISAVLAAEERGELQLEGLYLAEEGGVDVGACLTLTQRDRSAFVWPPVVLDSANWQRVGSAILREIEQRQRAEGIVYAQSILDPAALDEQSLFENNHFESLAELDFMECTLNETSAGPPQLKGGTECHAASLAELGDSELFAQTLERTYEETLDVPQFNLMRTGKESLESHRQNGPFDPTLWFLYFIDEDPAGMILLRDFEQDNKWEVAYTGVVPEHRGLGLGGYMLAETLHRSRALGRSAVFLAVDSRNHYARKIYRRLGFLRTATKQVLIRK